MVQSPSSSRWRTFSRRFRRHKAGTIGGMVLAVIAGCAILAPVLPLKSTTEIDLTSQVAPPSRKHLLGTDSYGRDLLARLVHGARMSLLVGAASVGLSMSVGVGLGLVAGYYGGVLDDVVMRLMDAVFTLPPILLAIALVGLMGPNARTVIVALAIVYTPRFARIVRASTLSEREREYVPAARAIGCGTLRIMRAHLLPNLTAPVVVQATATYAYAILMEAGLSFLGLGIQPPTPSWGLMLSEARTYIEDAPFYPILTGMAIAVTVLALNLFGDGLRDVLDPRMPTVERGAIG